MRHQWMLPALALLLAPTVAAAGGLELGPQLTSDQLVELGEHVAEAIDMPAGPARPLGVTGFELHVGGMWVRADEDAEWWEQTVSEGSELVDGVDGYHAFARKGLPAGFDVGAQFGSVLGEDFWSAEVRYAVIDGGLAAPALGVRGAWSELAGGPVDLQVLTAQATLSKGFTVLTPYVAAGVRWTDTEATVQEELFSLRLESSSETFVFNAGVHISLPPVGLRVEARRGHQTALLVSAGFSL